MRKYTICLSLSLVVAMLATDSSAAVISINFTDGGPGMGNSTAGKIAGVVEAGFWETAQSVTTAKNDTNVSNLRDDSGAYTGVSLSKTGIWGAGSYQASTTGFNTGTALQSNVMMENFTDTNGGTLTVSGLGYSKYDVYVYTARNDASESSSYSIGSDTFYHASAATFSGPFAQYTFADRTTAEANRGVGNYAKFSNITGSSFTLTVGNFGSWSTVNGMQIVEVPEPSTLSLVTLALLGLIGFGRRRSIPG
jgi:hypothetical protein